MEKSKYSIGQEVKIQGFSEIGKIIRIRLDENKQVIYTVKMPEKFNQSGHMVARESELNPA
jgi:hypothetical protein